MRIGNGFDVHKLVENRKLILGGVDVPYELGLLGHSDADVLIHAIIDSILGALGEGDIGKHFPDTDAKYKNVDSCYLLEEVYKLMISKGYCIGNVDATVILEKPKLRPYIDEMQCNIAKILNTDVKNINVKATTTEKLGYTGRGEGVASQSVCLLEKIQL